MNSRVQELLDLAADEGIKLPMAPMLIVWFEDRGYVVDLHTGTAWRSAAPATPTPSGRAVAHLLAHEVGVVKIRNT